MYGVVSGKIQDLKDECFHRGISLSPEVKYDRKSLVGLLASDSLRGRSVSPGLSERLRAGDLMQCERFEKLLPVEKAEVFNSDRWIAERKYYGSRVVASYFPDHGFSFHSRGLDEKTFVPLDYTDKLLLEDSERLVGGRVFAGRYPFSFTLDCEIVLPSLKRRTRCRGFETHYVSEVLNTTREDSHKLQGSGFRLYPVAFDCLMLDGEWMVDRPLQERKEFLSLILAESKAPILESSWVQSGKQEFYDRIVSEGGEGVVFKNLYAPYDCLGKRRKDRVVKLRWDSMAPDRDLDVFVTGFYPPFREDPYQQLVGGLRVSVYFEDENAYGVKQCVGTVRNLPTYIRSAISETTGFGRPMLKHDFWGKVLTVKASRLDMSTFSFGVLDADWGIGFREDKNRYNCTSMRDDLLLKI